MRVHPRRRGGRSACHAQDRRTLVISTPCGESGDVAADGPSHAPGSRLRPQGSSTTPPGWSPADPPALPAPAAPLGKLMSLVRAARGDVRALRAGSVDPALLVAARGVLLDAMEGYAAELAKRRLPLPPGL